jgi:uncharacterized protein (UPF0248 family)
MSKRKGSIREIISKALYYDDPSLYSVYYRDFETVVQVTLKDFLESSNYLETIPVTRIIEIRKASQVLYRKIGYGGKMSFENPVQS